MIHSIAVFVFWCCAVLVVYTYLLYPALLLALANLRRSRTPPDDLREADLPTVSVLIVAHNEEISIRARIQNLLELDYPREKLELVIASDSSSDATVAISKEYEDQGVRVFDFSARTGKAGVLDRVIPKLAGSIAVLSDANTVMDPAAIKRLVRWFRDVRVGVVCGKLILTDPSTGRNVDSLYW